MTNYMGDRDWWNNRFVGREKKLREEYHGRHTNY